MFQLILGLGLVSCVFAQQPSFGACPEVEVMPNFDVSKYFGQWYDQYEYPSIAILISPFVTCAIHTYTPNNDGTFNAEGFEVVFSSPLKWNLTIKPDDTNVPAKMVALWPTAPFSITKSPYWVLDTDYTSYAAVWGCVDLLIGNGQLAWILTRDRYPSQEVIAKAKKAFEKNNLDVNHFKHNDQSRCPKQVTP